MRGERSRIEQDLVDRITDREAKEASIGLEVTILGDGEGTPEFKKRLDLKKRLSASPFVASVTIPEELYESFPAATEDEVEKSAIDAADVVLLLEGPKNEPLGGFTETRIYFDHSLPDKWFRLRPHRRIDQANRRPLIAGLASDPFRRIESFEYEPQEWEECGRITASCERRISLMAYRELDKRAQADEAE